MSRFWIFLDGGLLILSALIFIVNVKAYRRNKKRVGRIRAQWRIRFNFAFKESRFLLVLLLALLAVGAALLCAGPGLITGLDGLTILCLGLAFFPRYNFVAIGTEGILDRWVFIPWKSVKQKRVVEDRGRRYLELKVTAWPGSQTDDRLMRIRVPGDVSLILD